MAGLLRGPRPPGSLAGQYARWLTGLFVAVELVTLAASLTFVLLPLSHRAADDLAGLLVLSARTWVELPGPTRPAFEVELAGNHRLRIRPGMRVPPDTGLRHGPYLLFVEQALQQRLGRPVFFLSEIDAGGQRWLWTTVDAAGEPIGVGFATSRLQTYPVLALILTTTVGVVLVALLSWWMARRIVKPVAALEEAANRVAHGEDPALLPETGPRELANLARHFNVMARQVHALLDARTVLFAGVSHDLRTPLARMRLAIEMLSLKPSPSLLQRLERDVQEMDALISHMLALARGLSTETARSIELCPWLQVRAKAHAPRVAEAGASLAVACDGACRVVVAPSMLARVLDNLLLNALRYAPGPIEIVARSGSTAAETPSVRLGVLDRGPGIPPDRHAVAFRPFHRTGPQGQGMQGSFGLGLAVVQQLCRANGWHVSLQARAGGGLEAWIIVPAGA